MNAQLADKVAATADSIAEWQEKLSVAEQQRSELETKLVASTVTLPTSPGASDADANTFFSQPSGAAADNPSSSSELEATLRQRDVEVAELQALIKQDEQAVDQWKGKLSSCHFRISQFSCFNLTVISFRTCG